MMNDMQYDMTKVAVRSLETRIDAINGEVRDLIFERRSLEEVMEDLQHKIEYYERNGPQGEAQ